MDSLTTDPADCTRDNRLSIVMIHQGADRYGSDWVFLQSVRVAATFGVPHVVVGADGPLLRELEQYAGDVRVVPLGVLRRGNYSARGILLTARELMTAIVWLRRLFRTTQATLVYSNTMGVTAGLLAARFSGVPHLWHSHEILQKPSWVGRLLAILARWSGQVVLCVSAATAANLVRLSPSLESQIRVIRNGIDRGPYEDVTGAGLRAAIGVPEDAPLIALVGRIHPWKGQDYLLGALDLAPQPFRGRVHVALVGDVFPGYEDYKANLRARVQASGFSGQVHFLGYREDTAAIMKSSNVVAVPSTLPDPLPTVVLEAMACGRPVVATRIGGIPEMVVDGVTGFMVAPNSAKEYMARLLYVCEHPEEGGQMGEAGRRRVLSAFSLESYDHSLRCLLESLARRSTSGQTLCE